MKNILLALLFFAVSSYAIDSLKINNTYVDSAVLTAAELNEDNDSCEVWSERLVDTLNIGFTRWSDFNSGDSTLSRLNVDTIGSNPYIENRPTFDTVDAAYIRGNPSADSLTVQILLPDTVRGSPDFDSLSGDIRFTGLPTFDGAITGTRVDIDTIGDASGNVNLLLSTDNYTSPLKKFGFSKTSLESWSAAISSIQFGGTGSIWTESAEGAGNTYSFSSNVYFDGSYKRIFDDEVMLYQQFGGSHSWYSDSADTADKAFSPTSRMSLSTTKLDVDVDTLDVAGLADVGQLNVDKGLSLTEESATLLDGGLAIVTSSNVEIDTYGGAALDTLTEITYTGALTGTFLLLRTANGTRDILAKDGGNLNLSGDFLLNGISDVLFLCFNGSQWDEVSRSDN